ncbi:MAG: class I SAM-dependent methyltransferase [Alcanivoracaceae bacterium]|nr:class I SAM-dependent methyltransferase [Alcanivoracaceae bacterium]
MKNELSADGDFSYKSRIKSDYDSAIAYTSRKKRKHDAEMRLLLKGMNGIPSSHTVLDAPCGVGRASIVLARQGYVVTGIDLGEGAVSVAQEQAAEAGVDVTIERDDVEALSYGDKQFDATVCFRLFHHFPDDAVRQRVINELCRVSRSTVVISYLSAYSATSLKRQLIKAITGRQHKQYATRLRDLSAFFESNGFTLERDIPLSRFFHSLHLAVFTANPDAMA